ncbi:MAG TPA: Rid family hydrolase [Terriglobales bacterium]|nr:Rid family hydrolase [Terriglobales bacterium]
MQAEKTTPGRKHIKLDSEAPFSAAVLVGDTLYLSGCIGLDPITKRIPDELETEIRYLMESVQDALAKAGMTLNDLVYVQVFCPDVSLWDRFNAVYCTYFSSNFPARAFIGCGKLLFDAHFELQSIAVRT